MGCVPVSSVENAYSLVISVGQGLKELDEAMFVVDLLQDSRVSVSSQGRRGRKLHHEPSIPVWMT